MVNIVGFSRGGTHIFWYFVSSHSALKNAKLEINNLVGTKRIGLWNKLKLDVMCLLGIYNRQFDDVEANVVFKGVSSWYPGPIFKLLRGHDPMKYIEQTHFRNRPTIFLVKSRPAQIRSWMRRSAPEKTAGKAYDEHIRRWTAYSKKRPALFIAYEDFCQDPQAVTWQIWDWLELAKEPLPEKIEIMPKAHKAAPSALPAHAPERRWYFVPTAELISSLQKDGLSV